MAKKKQQQTQKVAGLRVTTKRDGFRRAGRAWHGATEIVATELTKEQLHQLKAEPMLTVEAIEIERTEEVEVDE